VNADGVALTNPDAGARTFLSDYGSRPADVMTWQVSKESGGTGSVATVVTSIMFDSSGNCLFRASYIENG